MAAPLAIDLAEAVLALHVGVILFNVFGLVAVPLGAWRGWRFVRVPWWRFLHLGALTVVAVQAVMGRACFLTLWQDALCGVSGHETPLIMGWVDHLIYLPLRAGPLCERTRQLENPFQVGLREIITDKEQTA